LSLNKEICAGYYSSILDSSKVCRRSVQSYDFSTSQQLVGLILDIIHRARWRIKETEWGNLEMPFLHSMCTILCQVRMKFVNISFVSSHCILWLDNIQFLRNS